jgi:drug/metabolite transporter (DMT)-like permease
VTGIAAALALAAAALFAMAAAAQQRAARRVPDDRARGTGLLRALFRSRLWWVGTVGDVGGYLAQAAALGFGSLLLVQPLLVTTLLFALPLGARWAGRRLSRADGAWALLLAVALAAFVVFADPTPGLARATFATWAPAAAILAALLVGCVVAARLRVGVGRAVLLAMATALAYGATAALTKGVVDLLGDGLVPLLTAWETYGLVVMALGGTLLQQSAFQAGGLAASLPVITVGEPVVAAVLGTAVLGEHVRVAGAGWSLIGVLVVVLAAATVALARSSAREAPVPG